MEKEYTVIVHNRDDLSDIEAEITASSGAGPIPNRTVDVANPRLGSKIQTHFMLTDEEAIALEADDRIRAVEIPPDQRDDIELVLNAYQDSNFYRGSQGLNNEVNWGLPRCIRDLNSFGNTQDWNFVKNNAPNTGFFEYGLDGLGVDVVTQDSGLQVDHPEFMIGEALDSEYNNGAISNVVGDGSDFFKRELTVNGVRIVGAGGVGGQTAVPDAWLEKVGRMFELFLDKDAAGINETAQRNVIKTLRGDAGTYHASVGPTLQRVARGAGSDYTPNFLTDAGIASYNLSPLFDSHVANDMVWYLNSTGDPPGDGDNDAQEVIEHVFHTLHMHGLDAVSLKMYSYISADWASGPLYAAMEEAYDAGKWDSSGYGGNAWKTDGDAFEVAAKEYLFLLNFGMFEYSSLWDGGSLSPEWTDDMRTQSGIQANNPLGYALHNTYIAPVISKPSLTTIRTIFQDGDTGNPTLAGASGYVVSTAGTSRVQQINWYTASGLAGTQSADHYRDYDGHGTHCAGIACGKTYGWAKRARVYSQKLGGLEGAGDAGTGIPITDAFDTIRLWHNQKGITATGYKRPTVVNMSWGYQGTAIGDPVSGVYRGQAWNFGDVGYTSDTEVWASSGVVPPLGQFRRFTSQVASVDAEIEDMVSDGIVVCIASGNSYYKSDVTGGPDFNNQVTMSNGTRFYHRPGSPYASTALYVGNIDSTTQTEIVDGVTVYHDRPAASSVRGPAVDIWAPGSSIMSCASNFNNTFNYTQYDYPGNDAFKIMSIGGTSMASPQIAGIAALHLGSKPWMTPAQVKAVLLGDSTSVIANTGLIDDYTNSTTSLMGGENAHTVCRYGKQPLHYGGTPDNSLNGFIISQNGNDYHHYHLDATPTSDIEGATVVVTLTTIGVDDGTLVPYTITGVQAADIQGGSLVGNFNVVSGTAIASFTFLQDTVTEEDEILKLTLDSQRAHVEITIEANTT